MTKLDTYTYNVFHNTIRAISSLVVYSHLKDDPILSSLNSLLMQMIVSTYEFDTASGGSGAPGTSGASGTSAAPGAFAEDDRNNPDRLASGDFSCFEWTDQYTKIYADLMNGSLSSVPDLGKYVMSLVQKDDNAFSRMASGRYAGAGNASIDPVMRQCILSDFESILVIAALPSRSITAVLSSSGSLSLPNWHHDTTGQTASNLYDSLMIYQRQNSFGVFSCYHAFLWKNQLLEPVKNPDPIRLDQLFSYTYEISQVTENTLRLLRHKRADNILLFGARGTGKSSTVKAIANTYKDQGLRLIEIDKDDLLTIAGLLTYLAELSDVRLSFILFLDDLSFSEDDTRYTILKTLLEGGIKTRPENVAIYATSNRRHIVAEKETGEIYANDGKDEKLSLSDRFGISVRFASPNQQVYLDIVFGILCDRGVVFDREITAQKALTWAMRENGRSPRTARQFSDFYESSLESSLESLPDHP